jgi:hypothetical protein
MHDTDIPAKESQIDGWRKRERELGGAIYFFVGVRHIYRLPIQ